MELTLKNVTSFIVAIRQSCAAYDPIVLVKVAASKTVRLQISVGNTRAIFSFCSSRPARAMPLGLEEVLHRYSINHQLEYHLDSVGF